MNLKSYLSNPNQFQLNWRNVHVEYIHSLIPPIIIIISTTTNKGLPVLWEICWVGYGLPLRAIRTNNEELKAKGEGRTCVRGSDKGNVGSRTLQEHNTFYVFSCCNNCTVYKPPNQSLMKLMQRIKRRDNKYEVEQTLVRIIMAIYIYICMYIYSPKWKLRWVDNNNDEKLEYGNGVHVWLVVVPPLSLGFHARDLAGSIQWEKKKITRVPMLAAMLYYSGSHHLIFYFIYLKFGYYPFTYLVKTWHDVLSNLHTSYINDKD